VGKGYQIADQMKLFYKSCVRTQQYFMNDNECGQHLAKT